MSAATPSSALRWRPSRRAVIFGLGRLRSCGTAKFRSLPAFLLCCRATAAPAPDKLIGWAFFDNVPFAENTKENRPAYAKSVDFYGVNAFQPQTVSPLLDAWKKERQDDTARPVFLAEFGIPSTGHRNDNSDPLAIYSDASTIQKAADSMAKMLPLVFQHPAVAGVFYFEWSDE